MVCCTKREDETDEHGYPHEAKAKGRGLWPFAWGGKMSDEDLKKHFEEFDADKSGHLTKEEVKQAMQKCGQTDERIEEDLKEMKSDKLDFEGFRAFINKPEAVAPTEEEKLKEKFESLDAKKEGKLKKDVVEKALREMGRSDAEVEEAMKSITEDTVDVDGFVKVSKAKSRFSFALPAVGLPGWAHFGAYSKLSDEELKEKFTELDHDKSGKLDKVEVGKALKACGRSDAEVEEDLKAMKSDHLDFDGFKELVKPKSKPLFGGFGSGDSKGPTDEELKAKFDEQDSKKTGSITRAQIKKALTNLGQTDAEVTETMKSMIGDQADFDGFKEMVTPKPKSMFGGFSLGGSSGPTDELIQETFNECDKKKKGKLNKEQTKRALGSLGKTDAEVEEILKNVSDDTLDFAAFTELVKPKPKSLFGGFSLGGASGPTDEEIQAKFEEQDKKKKGNINQDQVKKALIALGKTEAEVDETMKSVSGSTVDLDAFKDLVKPKPKSMFGGFAFGGASGPTDEELKAKFDEQDPKKNGKIDKDHMKKALAALGKTEAQIEEAIQALPVDSVHLGGFKELAHHKHQSFFAAMSGAVHKGPTDEEINAKFDEQDLNKTGRISKEEIKKALHALGRTDADVDEALALMSNDLFDFDTFKEAVAPKSKSLFSGFHLGGSTGPTDEEFKAKFDEQDPKKTGKISKEGIQKALGGMGKTEAEVEEAMKTVSEDSLDLDGFKTAFKAAHKPMFTMPSFSFGHYATLTDEQLKEEFVKLDADKSGKLDKKEVGTALKELGKSDAESEEILKSMPGDHVDFEGFKELVRPKSKPLFGGFGLGGSSATSDEELKAKFDEEDPKKTGRIDKAGIKKALTAMGKTDAEVEEALKTMTGDSSDFDGFKELFKAAKTSMWPSFSFGGWSKLTDEQLKEEFDKLDADKSGRLDKAEVKTGLVALGQSEANADEAVKSMPADSIDFEGFKEMARPTPKGWFGAAK